MLEVRAEDGQELPLSGISMEFCHEDAETDKGAVVEVGYTVSR